MNTSPKSDDQAEHDELGEGLPPHIALLARFKQSVTNTALLAAQKPPVNDAHLNALAELYGDIADLDRYARISAGLEPRGKLPQWVVRRRG